MYVWCSNDSDGSQQVQHIAWYLEFDAFKHVLKYWNNFNNIEKIMELPNVQFEQVCAHHAREGKNIGDL